MLIDFRGINKHVPNPIEKVDEFIDRVNEYKYLGIVIDDGLKGSHTFLYVLHTRTV